MTFNWLQPGNGVLAPALLQLLHTMSTLLLISCAQQLCFAYVHGACTLCVRLAVSLPHKAICWCVHKIRHDRVLQSGEVVPQMTMPVGNPKPSSPLIGIGLSRDRRFPVKCWVTQVKGNRLTNKGRLIISANKHQADVERRKVGQSAGDQVNAARASRLVTCTETELSRSAVVCCRTAITRRGMEARSKMALHLALSSRSSRLSRHFLEPVRSEAHDEDIAMTPISQQIDIFCK